MTILLMEGIGDTIRVSLSGDPVDEVVVAAAILTSLGLRKDFPELISCPTCGRSNIDVAEIAGRLERILPSVARGMKIAVMGCEVNGPGEAREADVGLAGTPKGAVIFSGGRITRKAEGDPVEELLREIEKIRPGSESR
jgi:(E)-4-hydroxy-3-methylbut-2-enyl-diphosphate synthase